MVNILGFAGSLRKGSYNKALLRAAVELAPENAKLETFDLEGQDMEKSMPDKGKEFKSKIKSADALLIVTPEHNYSIPGVLKNAIDWASSPYEDNSFEGKPVAIMSASTGMFGGARAQYHLRQAFVFLDMFPVNRPEVFVTSARQKFDEKARELIKKLLEALITWTNKLKSS